jgi:two-component system NtrC family sensor kinase
LRLGTKLTIYLSLVIVLVLSGYGYFHVISRKDILLRMMKVEVRGIGQTLQVSLEKLWKLREMDYVQPIIDSVEEYEKTLGVVVFYHEKNLPFASRSLDGGIEPYIDLIKKSIREDRGLEEFTTYKKIPIFLHTFPLKDRRGKKIGGVGILQHLSFVEEEIHSAEWGILIIILTLMGGTVTLVLFFTRRWISRPASHLMAAIQRIGQGDLAAQINLGGGGEFSELAQEFNQMAVALKGAQDRLIHESEARMELERNLRQSEKLATIGQLASGLAHEIGTPLNIISGRVELIKRKSPQAEGLQRNLDIVLQQTERITKIIHQLLGFVRKKKPEQVILNIRTLLENTLDFLDQQIEKQGVKVQKDIAEILPPLPGDPDQLQQVFLNLLLNALQSMPAEGILRLGVSAKWIFRQGLQEGRRQYVEVRVEDTGVGMEKEVRDNIFRPFFTTKEKGKGTGLGLTVSHGIVQDHEGWVEVESQVGKGSVFKVYLPAVEMNDPRGETDVLPRNSGEGQGAG